jgi:hypothetical protein
MLDGKTGKPRTIIDIDKAALLNAEEGRDPPTSLTLKTVQQNRVAQAE